MLSIEKEEHQRVANIKSVLLEKLGELKSNVDENRLEQELIYYLEKLDCNRRNCPSIQSPELLFRNYEFGYF